MLETGTRVESEELVALVEKWLQLYIVFRDTEYGQTAYGRFQECSVIT